MILLFYVDNFLLFSTSKDKTEDVYASIKADFNIEDYGYLKKYWNRDVPSPIWFNPFN